MASDYYWAGKHSFEPTDQMNANCPYPSGTQAGKDFIIGWRHAKFDYNRKPNQLRK